LLAPPLFASLCIRVFFQTEIVVRHVVSWHPPVYHFRFLIGGSSYQMIRRSETMTHESHA
jgi:hypothetical protein